MLSAIFIVICMASPMRVVPEKAIDVVNRKFNDRFNFWNHLLKKRDTVALQPVRWGGSSGMMCTPESELNCGDWAGSKVCYLKVKSKRRCCYCVGEVQNAQNV